MKNANKICTLFDYDEYSQSSKKKREYVKGGRGGKIKGFKWYLKDEHLSKRQRQTLIRVSEIYDGTLIDFSGRDIGTSGFDLDSQLANEEFIEYWNETYDRYGYLFPQFKDQWERENIRGYNKYIKENKCKVRDESSITDEDRTNFEEYLKSRRTTYQQNDDNYVDLG